MPNIRKFQFPRLSQQREKNTKSGTSSNIYKFHGEHVYFEFGILDPSDNKTRKRILISSKCTIENTLVCFLILRVSSIVHSQLLLLILNEESNLSCKLYIIKDFYSQIKCQSNCNNCENNSLTTINAMIQTYCDKQVENTRTMSRMDPTFN